jgi:NADH dehydrogenase
VFVSFPPTELDSPLERAKRRVEAHLKEGSLSYTILRPVDFMEVWLSPMVGFNPAEGKVTVFGDGKRPVSWISVRDVARFVAAATEGPQFAGKVLPLGGPEPLSPLKVVDIFREVGGRDVQVDHVTDATLRQEMESASDPRSKTFAALKLSTALGQAVDPGPALALMPGRLVTVRDYATSVLNRSPST